MTIMAGRLKHVIEVQRRVAHRDDYGEQQYIWETVHDCRASIEPLRGTETHPSSVEFEQVECRIRMRYHPNLADLSARDRIIRRRQSDEWDIYEIVSVTVPWEMNREVVVMCMRGTRDDDEVTGRP